jgi:hypothetical protein
MFGEQMLFTVERPIGQRIMTMSIVCEQTLDPASMEDVPVLSCRVIPNSEEGKPPSVAELVRLDVAASIHSSADGTPELYSGRASLTMDASSPVDPWHLLAPTRLLQGSYGVFDFDLYYGKVVKDYLAEAEIWSSNGVPAGVSAGA